MIEVKSFSSQSNLTFEAAKDAALIINHAISLRGRASIVLTGGTLGIQILKDLALIPMDLSKVHVVFSDERFVGLGDPDRNEHQALEAWPQLGTANLLRYPDNNDALGLATQQFDTEVKQEFSTEESAGKLFDLAILGMGPDGHVASLFPGHTHPSELVVSEANSPKPPAQRISLSYEALNRVENLFFLASGSQKAGVAKCAIKDAKCDLPAAKVKGLSLTRWYVDEEISREL